MDRAQPEPQAKITPRDYWAAKRAQRIDAFAIAGNEGPILHGLKRACGLDLWHWPIEHYTLWRLTAAGVADEPMPARLAKAQFIKRVEAFWILWTGLLILAYVFAARAARHGPWSTSTVGAGLWHGAILAAVCSVALYRVGEIVAVALRLFVLVDYATHTRASALVLTFLGYAHVLLAFATLYLGAAFFYSDPFSQNTAIWSGQCNALYFSAVTITTVGYGDFAPRYGLGQLLVIAEILVGLLVLVIAVQRVVAVEYRSLHGEPSPRPDEPRQSAP